MTSKGHKIGQNVAKFRNVKKFGEVEGRSEQQDPEYIGESSPGIELSSPFSNPNTNNALHVHGKAGKRGVSRMTKSSSVSSIQNNNPDFQGVDHDDIIGLTQDVKAFSDGLAKLKIVITEPTAVGEDARVMSHECLGDVLCILKNILQQYPALQSTDIFSASGSLITHIKNYNYDESDAIMYQALCDAIDQLALAFSSSVSEYLMGDLENIHEKEIKTKSYDNLITASKDAEDEMDFRQNEVQLKPEEIDGTLLKLQAGVDLALQRAKAWSKYMKDLVSYIERKAQHETEYAKNLSRLAQSMRPVLTEEGFLPLQSVYCTVLAQDMEYASTCLAIQTVLETTQFVEPLTARRIEHDKVKRTVKDTWMKEVKRMQDAMQNLRKAQTLYVTRQQEYEKAREQFQKSESDMAAHTTSTSTAAKVDKRKKVEEEAMHKAAEAETTYKACVADANNRQQELGKVKAEILAKIREQIFLCDQVIQTVTVDYFHLLQTVAAPIPVQYHALCDSSKLYEPGTQFGEFVRRLPVSSIGTVNNEPFTFEAYIQRDTDERKPSIHSNGSANSDHPSRESSPQLKHRKDKYRVKAWGQGVQGFFLGSDTDSASGSSKSLDSSPSNSPHPVGQRRELIAGSSDLLGVEESVEGVDVSSSVKQLLSPHSTDSTDASGLLKMEHCRATVPPIITKCSREIERKGLLLEGIYRVSGVKSKVEGLCKRFEKNPDAVDLTEEHPNVISNVLKLYLRELPVPLLTFRLYPSFIQIAKENIFDPSETTQKLQKLVVQLPFSNQKTCGVLMHHLQRVVSRCEFNLMNAQNLGIVFGPTLLRPLEGTDYLASLDDTPHQTRAVELLIINAENLFGKCEDNELFPGETPVEKLTHTENNQPPQSQSQQPKEPQESQQVTKSPQVSRPSASKSPQIQSSQDIKAQVAKMHDPAKGTSRHSSSSSSVSDRAVEQLIQSGSQASSEANRQQKKVTGDSFVLPGSTHTDKKDTSSLGGTAVSSQDDQEEVIDLDDLQSDDDDLLLPDGSNCQHAMGSSVVSCHKGIRITDIAHYSIYDNHP